MLNISNTASLLIAISIIAAIAYFIKKGFPNQKNGATFFNNGDYCDYCGAKLLQNPISSSPWSGPNRTCPRCGYNCKEPGG